MMGNESGKNTADRASGAAKKMQDARAQKLRLALRENLKRRKAQSRARHAPSDIESDDMAKNADPLKDI